MTIRKDPDPGKDWKQEEKGTTEAEMVGWHHWLMGHALGDEGQGSLICCSSWGHKELDMTEWLNNNESKAQPPVCIWNETEEAEIIQTWRTVQAKIKKKMFNSKGH